MTNKNWIKEIRSIPNLLSLLRLGLIPVYVYLYLRANSRLDYAWAGLILTLSCVTDFWDGWIARHFHMTTNLGKILDPIADKATQLALMICLSTVYSVLYGVLLLFLVKELFQAGLGLFFLHKGRILTGAIWAGKLCTALFFGTLILMVLIPGLPNGLVTGIALLDSILLLNALVQYTFAYLGDHPRLEKLE